jgi:hypothetical protein
MRLAKSSMPPTAPPVITEVLLDFSPPEGEGEGIEAGSLQQAHTVHEGSVAHIQVLRLAQVVST